MGLIYGKFYNEIFNIAPGEGQIRVSFTSESNSESLVFPKEYSTGRNYFIWIFFRGEWPCGLRCYIQNWKVPVSTPQSAWLGFGTERCS